MENTSHVMGPMIPYATPAPPTRPTTVLVMGIIGIVYASFGLLGGLGGLVMTIFMMMLPASAGMRAFTPEGQTVWNFVFAIGGSLLAGALLVASIGSLKLWHWARRLMLHWAWAYAAFQVFAVVVQLLVILPATLALIASPPPGAFPGAPAGASPPATPMPGFMTPMMYGSALLGLLFGLVFPACVLIFMTRANVRAAFDRGPDALGDAQALPQTAAQPAPVAGAGA